PFKPSGNIDAITENIALLYDDVANMDADAKFDAFILWSRRIALDHATLDFDSVTHGVDSASKFDENSVAGSLNDSTAVLGYLGFEKFTTVGVQPRECALLVGTHQSAVTSNIAGDDGS